MCWVVVYDLPRPVIGPLSKYLKAIDLEWANIVAFHLAGQNVDIEKHAQRVQKLYARAVRALVECLRSLINSLLPEKTEIRGADFFRFR